MFDWINFVAQEKQREFILNREAEQLVREALAADEAQRQHFTPVYYEALAALGRRLTAVGEDLQSRFGDSTPLPMGEVSREQG